MPTPQIAERHETTTRQFVAQFSTRPVKLSCRPVPNDKGITLADTLKRGSAKGSSETRRPRKGQERTSAPCPADRSRIPCICPERQHEKYKLRDFFRGMHTRREPLCGSVRRFPVPGGSFSRGAGWTAYKGVQRAEMLRNVEVFKKYKKRADAAACLLCVVS